MKLILLNEKQATLGDGIISETIEGWFSNHNIEFLVNPQDVSEIRHSDGVVIGGGGLLFTTGSLPYFHKCVEIAQTHGIRVACIGLGWYLQNEQSLKYWRDILQYADLVTVRNYDSKAIAVMLCGIPDKEVFVYPDIGFMANLGSPLKGDNNVIGILPRPEVEPNFKTLSNLLKKRFEPIIIPFAYAKYDHYEEIAKKYKWKISHPAEQFKPLKKCGYVLSYRYHGAVFSILLNKPFLQYDDVNFKTSSLLRETGYLYSFTSKEGAELIFAKISGLVNNSDFVKSHIHTLKEILESKSKQHFIKLKEWLDNE